MIRSAAILLVAGLVLGFGLFGAAGCAAGTADTATGSGASWSLNGFLQALQRQGVSVTQGGPPGDALVGDGMRVLVNSREYVDVYVFQNASQASSQASGLTATSTSSFRIYQKDNVVAIRLTKRDPSVDAALEEVLGPARF